MRLHTLAGSEPDVVCALAWSERDPVQRGRVGGEIEKFAPVVSGRVQRLAAPKCWRRLLF